MYNVIIISEYLGSRNSLHKLYRSKLRAEVDRTPGRDTPLCTSTCVAKDCNDLTETLADYHTQSSCR